MLNGNTELKPMGRFEWERIVRRLVVPKHIKLLLLVLGTYADADGSRVRPGTEVLAAITGDGEKNVRRIMTTVRDLGLLELVSRGGGRGGKGKASEYRLTIPVDLIERVQMLTPECHEPYSPDIWMSTQSPVDKPESLDTQMSAHCGQSPVDNSESPDTQMSTQSDGPPANDRTSHDRSNRMTGHLATNDRTSRCPTTSHDQPPTTTRSQGVEDVTTVPSPAVDVDDGKTQMSAQLAQAANAAEPTHPPWPPPPAPEHSYTPGPHGTCTICDFPEANARHRHLRAI